MAIDKAVDSGVLDAGLSSIANKIRSRSGGSSQLAFPNGFVSEIDNIPSGGGDNLPARADGSITSFSDDTITQIVDYAFYNCTQLESVNCSAVSTVGSNAFYGNTSLLIVDLGGEGGNIGARAFRGSPKLRTLILRSTTLVTLSNANALDGTYIQNGSGKIYVPRALISTYQSATNWSNLASKFAALEDYQG